MVFICRPPCPPIFVAGQRQMKKNLCDLCVLSEAGGEKVIEITRSNPTAQVEIIPLAS